MASRTDEVCSPQQPAERMMRRSRRWLWVFVVLLVGAATIVGIPGSRRALLRAAGWALVVDEAIGLADVIVIAVDADGAGVLEAADLFHAGIARRVAVFEDPPDAVGREFLRRGVPYENRAARAKLRLRGLGVTAVEEIARASGTESGARGLPGWCEQHRIRSLVFVTRPDHSRRVRRVLRRTMKGRPTSVMVHSTRYSDFDPDRWWQSRDGIRTYVIEVQKLLLDVILHPGS
jgi:hypothetical protein